MTTFLLPQKNDEHEFAGFGFCRTTHICSGTGDLQPGAERRIIHWPIRITVRGETLNW